MDKRKDFFHFAEILVLLLFTLTKTIILHINIKSQNIILLTIAIIPPLLIIYGLLNLIKSKRRNLFIVLGHTLISVLLFADIMYFQHYGFLPSVRLIPLIQFVPAVSDSVAFLVNPINVVMLIDIIPIIIYFRRKKEKQINYSLKFRLVNKYIVILMLAVFIVNIMFIDAKSTYAYSNYGVYTYHVYDIIDVISDNNHLTGSKEYGIDDVLERIEKNNNDDSEIKKYQGIAKNRNVIMIQFESLQDFVINMEYNGQEITPNMNKLIAKDSIYFDNYYQQVGPGNTSDAEFVTHNSMYPDSKYSIYKKFGENDFYTLPHVLGEEGYTALAFHGFREDFWNRNVIYPTQGISDYISLEDFNKDDIIGMGVSDKSFYEQSIEVLKEVENPFYAFMITLTSHTPYKIPDEYVNLELLEEHEGTLFGNYIQSVRYADEALGEFIEALKKESLYDDSIIIIYGDHSGLFCSREDNKKIMAQITNHEYEFDESSNVPLIINIPGSEIVEKNSKAGSHVDLYPTILNLLGLENNKGIMFGQDLNNSKEGFVACQYYVPIGSFIDDEKVFMLSKDAVFENGRAWDLKTKEPIDIEKCREGYERAIEEISFSNYILENNLLKEVLNENAN